MLEARGRRGRRIWEGRAVFVGESLRREFDREVRRIFLRTPVVVLEAGFLHLELGYHIHQDHNARMQKNNPAIQMRKNSCIGCHNKALVDVQVGVHCSLHISPSGYHNSLPRHIAKQWTTNSKNSRRCLRRRTGSPQGDIEVLLLGGLLCLGNPQCDLLAIWPCYEGSLFFGLGQTS